MLVWTQFCLRRLDERTSSIAMRDRPSGPSSVSTLPILVPSHEHLSRVSGVLAPSGLSSPVWEQEYPQPKGPVERGDVAQCPTGRTGSTPPGPSRPHVGISKSVAPIRWRRSVLPWKGLGSAWEWCEHQLLGWILGIVPYGWHEIWPLGERQTPGRSGIVPGVVLPVGVLALVVCKGGSV